MRFKVDIIVTAGPAATGPAKEATSTIPIVMAQDSDPVESGFVASLARPGGNITGLSTLAPEVSGKRLELLKEIIPKLSRVAVLGISTRPVNPFPIVQLHNRCARGELTLGVDNLPLPRQRIHCGPKLIALITFDHALTLSRPGAKSNGNRTSRMFTVNGF